jgi:hypothetical protein
LSGLARSYSRRRTSLTKLCAVVALGLLVAVGGGAAAAGEQPGPKVSGGTTETYPASPNPLRFELFESYGVGSWSESVAVGDVTGDGRDDVVLSTSFAVDPDNDYKLFLFRQQARGGLAPKVRFSSHGSGGFGCCLGLAIGDLTGDGLNDVALATPAGVDLYEQRGGTLTEPELVPGTQQAAYLVIADMDADGLQDILIDSNRGVLLARNTGSGFDISTVTPTGQGEVETGDVTGDGRLDVVGFVGDVVKVYPQLPDRTYGGPFNYDGVGNSGEGIDVADVSGDGREDVVFVLGPYEDRLNVFLQNSAGTLDPPAVYTNPVRPVAVEAKDMSGDGRADVVTAGYSFGRAGIYLQSSNGTLEDEDFYEIPSRGPQNPIGLDLGDVNGDGLADIAIADYEYGLIVLRQQSSAPPPPTPPPPPPAPPPRSTSRISPTPSGPSPTQWRSATSRAISATTCSWVSWLRPVYASSSSDPTAGSIPRFPTTVTVGATEALPSEI